jgi:homoserine O-acetyltransferase
VAAARATIWVRTLLLGITSDVLFPLVAQRKITAGIAGVVYGELDYRCGHDGLLLETVEITAALVGFCAVLAGELQCAILI